MRDYRRDLTALLAAIPASVSVAPTLLPPSANTRLAYSQAREQYERVVTLEAHRLQKLYGFSWEAVEDAPNTYAALVAEFNHCRLTGKPFRVWSGGSDKTVFSAPAINHAFRFVHDLGHVADGCDLTEQGEVDVITAFVWRVFSQAGFLAALLAACDLLGQLYYGTNNHGAFVDDQESFVSSLFFMLIRSHHENIMWDGDLPIINDPISFKSARAMQQEVQRVSFDPYHARLDMERAARRVNRVAGQPGASLPRGATAFGAACVADFVGVRPPGHSVRPIANHRLILSTPKARPAWELLAGRLVQPSEQPKQQHWRHAIKEKFA